MAFEFGFEFPVIGDLTLLGGLFVLGGAGYPAAPSPGLDLADPDVDPGEHAGEHVETGGEIVATDPVVVEIEDDGATERVEIENSPDVEVGQDLYLEGELNDHGTIATKPERAIVREPWERTYMYAISVLAALFVAARGIDGWRVNLRSGTVQPRDRPLHERVRDILGEMNG